MPTATTCPGPVACLAGILRLLVAGFIERAPRAFPPGALVDAVWRRIQRLGAHLRWLAKTTTPPRDVPSRRPAIPTTAPRGYPRTARVNQLGYEWLEARQRAAAPAPDPALKSA